MQNDIEETLLADNGESEEFAESIDDEELKKPLLTEIARKKHFREKFEKEEAARKELEAKLAELQAKPEPQVEKSEPKSSDLEDTVASLQQAEQKRQFGYENGLDPRETDQVFAYAQGLNVDPSEAKDSVGGKALIEAIRAENKANDITPNTSGTATLAGGKTLAQVTTDPKASDADKQAAFEERMSKTKVNQNN